MQTIKKQRFSRYLPPPSPAIDCGPPCPPQSLVSGPDVKYITLRSTRPFAEGPPSGTEAGGRKTRANLHSTRVTTVLRHYYRAYLEKEDNSIDGKHYEKGNYFHFIFQSNRRKSCLTFLYLQSGIFRRNSDISFVT
ncbi:hypothetical protein KI387_040239, partial [Taxus chinensis]